jgi:hypothetical protein
VGRATISYYIIKRSSSISVDMQLLIALAFCASGTFEWGFSSSYSVTQPTESCIVSIVSEVLCSMASTFIQFPSDAAELRALKQRFNGLAGMPSVIGAIDGSQIPIKTSSFC